jgi:RimJ/RimL family protein N-acetyltransferase
MAEIPVLTTERLILRGHCRDDVEALHTLWSEPAVYRYTTGKPPTREQSWARLIRYAGFWQALGFGQWAVTDRSTSSYIGNAGIMDCQRDLDPVAPAGPEAGWVFAPGWHGKGLAQEAMRAVLGWSDARGHTPKSWCMITPGNDASLRLAGKLGFGAGQRATYKGGEVVVLIRAAQAHAR